MISVLTPTIRPQFLGVTKNCLEQQTNQDFEWLVEIGFPARGFTLPSDFNKMLKRAAGDVIVVLQDCIRIPDDALEAISKLNHDKTAYTYPVGKTQVGHEQSLLGNNQDVQWDWRKSTEKARGTATLPSPAHWEIDFASAPRSLFFDVGGFDEDFNNGWSWENVEIANRAAYAGYSFEVSAVTEGVAFDHDKHIEHPFRGVRENNDRRATKSRAMAEAGRVKLSYL